MLHSHCHEKALAFAAATESGAGLPCPVSRCNRSTPAAAACRASSATRPSTTPASVAIAERVLLPAVRKARPGTVVLATGTSCRSQIHDLGGRAAMHPLEFLAARLVS